MITTAAPVHVVMDLPCFSSILAFLTETHDIVDTHAEGLDRIRIAIRDAENWEKALHLWAIAQDRSNTSIKEEETQNEKQSMTCLERVNDLDSFVFKFRASALRDGHHDFKKMDIYVAAGDGVCERWGDKAIVSLLKYDIEVGKAEQNDVQ